MNEQRFRAYLQTLKSSKTGQRLGSAVISNIVSRCASAERTIGRDLDTLDLMNERRPVGRNRHDSVIPDSVRGDYRSAVRKYLDFRQTM